MSKRFDQMNKIRVYPEHWKMLRELRRAAPIRYSMAALANAAIGIGLVKLTNKNEGFTQPKGTRNPK